MRGTFYLIKFIGYLERTCTLVPRSSFRLGGQGKSVRKVGGQKAARISLMTLRQGLHVLIALYQIARGNYKIQDKETKLIRRLCLRLIFRPEDFGRS